MLATYGRRSTDDATDCKKIPERANVCLTVDLMGGLKVRAGRTTMDPRDLGGPKLRRVLLALLLHRGAPVPKDRLVSLLWEGSPPKAATATLESYVCVLRKRLQLGKDTQPRMITTVAGCYAIDMSRVDLDLVRYERLMSTALHSSTPAGEALPMLQQAMTLAESPLLPEETDSAWLDDVRTIHNENIRRGQVAAANKVAELKSETAQQWARVALQGDPLDESAWQALLKGMGASGQHAAGLRAYDECRRLFAMELGCAPGPSLQKIYLQLLRGTSQDNEELSMLFDAVIQLHTASQTSARPMVSGRASEQHGPSHTTASVAKARHVLSLLLLGVDQAPELALGA